MKIGIIGAGNMGGATAWGMIKYTSLSREDLIISDPNEGTLRKFSDEGVETTSNNHRVAREADIVAVFVKPWLVERVLKEIKGDMTFERQMLIIVAAGIKGEQVEEWLECKPTFFSVIPNIAIEQGSSMTFLVPFNASASQIEKVRDIFDAMGETMIVEERLLPAATTLASCGLAYAMRYIRAAVEGGVEMGFYPKDALKIVLQTVKGAVDLLQITREHPEVAIDKVTTPGGVTIKGLNAMEEAGFTTSVIKGLKAGLK